MIGGAEASFISVSLACVDGEQQQQARGKGRIPEAGPRHGTAGLWVKPERAAAGTFSAAASIASTAATAIEAAGSVTHSAVSCCVRETRVTVCDRPAAICVRWDQSV